MCTDCISVNLSPIQIVYVWLRYGVNTHTHTLHTCVEARCCFFTSTTTTRTNERTGIPCVSVRCVAIHGQEEAQSTERTSHSRAGAGGRFKLLPAHN